MLFENLNCETFKIPDFSVLSEETLVAIEGQGCALPSAATRLELREEFGKALAAKCVVCTGRVTDEEAAVDSHEENLSLCAF